MDTWLTSRATSYITGASPGQGQRAHTLHLARQGADIIAMDICENIGNTYQLATPADLEKTVQGVKAFYYDTYYVMMSEIHHPSEGGDGHPLIRFGATRSNDDGVVVRISLD